MEPRIPKYGEGQRVVAGVDLYNDGSYPERAEGDLLIEKGLTGVVVQTGMHTATNTPVYMVDFSNGCVVGCLEEEIGVP